mmetsp:Transcript_16677/g.42393  ORF Transcript_16677/g.42393 Transcript_16677/m.42393 type:complete len:302 (+) Transcript_16677:778-1683(+)
MKYRTGLLCDNRRDAHMAARGKRSLYAGARWGREAFKEAAIRRVHCAELRHIRHRQAHECHIAEGLPMLSQDPRKRFAGTLHADYRVLAAVRRPAARHEGEGAACAVRWFGREGCDRSRGLLDSPVRIARRLWRLRSTGGVAGRPRLAIGLGLCVQRLDVKHGDGRKRDVVDHDALHLVEHDPALEERAIEGDRLVLAALPTHMEAKLLVEIFKGGLQILNSAAQVGRLEPHARDLDEDRLHLVLHHAVQHLVLRALPEIRERCEAEASTHVLDSQTLVRGQHCSRGYGLHFRKLLLDVAQ